MLQQQCCLNVLLVAFHECIIDNKIKINEVNIRLKFTLNKYVKINLS